jgi:hypothetical protein
MDFASVAGDIKSAKQSEPYLKASGSIAAVEVPKPNFDFSKAVKADDAAVLIFIWVDRIWALEFHKPGGIHLFHVPYRNKCPLTTLRELIFPQMVA